MRILHSGDWHIGVFRGPEKNGVNLRSLDTLNCISALVDTARREMPDVAVISGDLFDQAQVWASRGLIETRTAIGQIEQLAEVCPVVVLRGTPNHDGAEQFSMLQQHFSGGRYLDRVFVVTEPKVVRIDIRENCSVEIAALPGFDRGTFRAKFPGISKEDECQRFTEELGKIVMGLRAQCAEKLPAVLIAHYTVPGCNTESGQTQFFSQSEPVILPEVLDAAAFDLVALGHIHRPQIVESCRNTYYCGGINAMNYNDEGQERGFWLHELNEGAVGSSFFRTPAREFFTVHLNDADMTAWNDGCIDDVATFKWRGQIDGKIVRSVYDCSADNSKALNKALMEKELYDDGAFFVSDILPEKVESTVNRRELSEQTDPETNLIRYLDEKGYADGEIAPIVEVARPIIAEAAANNIVAQLSGVFEPIEIEVKNYRNYAEEKFSFRDITFCTINGKNGAGKSSLFMDAILDCLYEEPREGELTGWIRSDESARSGAITFTFRIGLHTFRISRTRAKSGKATLNLAELVDGEWLNRSKEKIRDTQDEIINTLGMDSLTFKSCALIMQDQYGLFLQADKEDRMTILGNILGLGIYGDMEQLARERVTDLNRQIGQKNTDINKQLDSIRPEESLRQELKLALSDIEANQSNLAEHLQKRELINQLLSAKEQSITRAAEIDAKASALAVKRENAQASWYAQNDTIAACSAFLSQEATIQGEVAKYNALLLEEKGLISGNAIFAAKSGELKTVQEDAQRLTLSISAQEKRIAETDHILADLQMQLEKEPELRAASHRYDEEKQQLDLLQQRGGLYVTMSSSITTAQKEHSEVHAAYLAECATRTGEINALKNKTDLLADCDCLDPDHAHCRFLSDAQEAKSRLEPYRAECTLWKTSELVKLEETQRRITHLEQQLDQLGYSAEAVELQQRAVAALQPQHEQYQNLVGVREKLGLFSDQKHGIEESSGADRQRLLQLNAKALTLLQEVEQHKAAAERHTAVSVQIAAAQKWLDQEKLLPVMKEKNTAAQTRLVELQNEISSLDAEMQSLRQEADTLKAHAAGAENLKIQCADLNNQITSINQLISTLQMNVGAFNQRLRDIDRTKKAIQQLQQEIKVLSEKMVAFDLLKQAFGQDGIPHNIICSIVPQLTDTANSILGQMTGGKMGMEFRTDKILKSNSKKEVPTLDIIITEYGKDSLPYLSKSGGEKVKSALSAILALAEIKSTSAGIQLGMLFIDEPPFLDDDGTQAYCDALEAIQSRYSSIKIMAITHDESMKARFPQSLDVVKTEEGSKVVID